MRWWGVRTKALWGDDPVAYTEGMRGDGPAFGIETVGEPEPLPYELGQRVGTEEVVDPRIPFGACDSCGHDRCGFIFITPHLG